MRRKSSKFTDEEIIRAIKGGGPAREELRYLYQRHFPYVLNYVLKRGGRREDGEDVFQEGMAILVVNVRGDKFQGKSSLGRYLERICWIKWWQRWKKKFPDLFEDQRLREIAGATPVEPDFMLVKEEARTIVRNFFERMGKKCLEIVDRQLLGIRLVEIAQILTYKNAASVANTKSRCLKKLKANLEADPEFLRLAKELEWKI